MRAPPRVTVSAGRFAPSPTGELHLGNLRTALIAWLSARAGAAPFLVRMEDLDRITSAREHEAAQLAALTAIGIDWDGPVVRQSDRFDRYEAAVEQLAALGRTYECYCSRREIRDATRAPHGELAPDGAYPGTCRRLTSAQRAQHERAGRRPALRLLADEDWVEVVDELVGRCRGRVDDVVLRRNDGIPAYNLAVVVDDAAQGVGEVVRGDDLFGSTPRQVLLQQLLGLPTPRYVHVPLVLGADGVRLSKRHGAVSLSDLADMGVGPGGVLALLASSLGLAEVDAVVTAAELVERFDRHALPREPWIVPPDLQRSVP